MSEEQQEPTYEDKQQVLPIRLQHNRYDKEGKKKDRKTYRKGYKPAWKLDPKRVRGEGPER